MAEDNVRPLFRVVSDNGSLVVEPPPPPEADEVPLSPHQQALYASIYALCKYFTDNKDSIAHFVTIVADSQPTDDDPDMKSYQIISSPLTAADMALSIKMLDQSFTDQLNGRKL